MRKLLLMVVCAVSVSALFCEKACAEAYVHDGFFLRVAPGFGWNTTSSDTGGSEVELSGVSGMFNLAIGGAVAQDLVLHLDISGVGTSDPKVRVNGTERAADVSSATTSMAGIGLTYYFPSNVYVTGAVGIAKSRNKSGGIEYTTDTGFGVNLMVGKEWWVSDNWGLGVAGQFLYTNCPDKVAGDPFDVKSTSFGILLSATYN
ncbi:MAG: autotransporter outer membrane beta-barrel domain-containing protein [Desulfuromonadaceae bacterium]